MLQAIDGSYGTIKAESVLFSENSIDDAVLNFDTVRLAGDTSAEGTALAPVPALTLDGTESAEVALNSDFTTVRPEEIELPGLDMKQREALEPLDYFERVYDQNGNLFVSPNEVVVNRSFIFTTINDQDYRVLLNNFRGDLEVQSFFHAYNAMLLISLSDEAGIKAPQAAYDAVNILNAIDTALYDKNYAVIPGLLRQLNSLYGTKLYPRLGANDLGLKPQDMTRLVPTLQ